MFVLLLVALVSSIRWAQAENTREFSQKQLALFTTESRPVLVKHFLSYQSSDSKSAALSIPSMQSTMTLPFEWMVPT